MTPKRLHISAFTSTLIFSLLCLVAKPTATYAQQQKKMAVVEKDTIPLFRGFSLSFDLVGAAMMAFGDRGEIEGALRVNLRDKWFPIVEIGIGRANRNDDEVTHLTYKTTAPYFRVGMDWNIMKNKHASNRLYAGFRYAFTSYKVDITREDLPDPVWRYTSDFGATGMSCSMHWLEAVFGLDAKIYGPLHLGWSVRYKRRLVHSDGDLGGTWYVPGFGINDKDGFAANFNVIIDI